MEKENRKTGWALVPVFVMVCLIMAMFSEAIAKGPPGVGVDVLIPTWQASGTTTARIYCKSATEQRDTTAVFRQWRGGRAQDREFMDRISVVFLQTAINDSIDTDIIYQVSADATNWFTAGTTNATAVTGSASTSVYAFELDLSGTTYPHVEYGQFILVSTAAATDSIDVTAFRITRGWDMVNE